MAFVFALQNAKSKTPLTVTFSNKIHDHSTLCSNHTVLIHGPVILLFRLSFFHVQSQMATGALKCMCQVPIRA